MNTRYILKPVYLCVLLALCGQPALGNPLNPAVVNGQASFVSSGNTLTVTNTPGTIINWQGFSIAANEVTRFAQQSAASAVLNRVTGNNPSSILGSLLSNGRVFLINPGGIVFGAGATVDVAGLVASTLNLSNADFLAGNMHFTQVPGAANIANAGNITGQTGGQIFLIAPNVENTGVITAANGEILLAAGYSVDLVSTSNPNLRVNITAPAGDATNVGQLVASAGRLGLFGTVVKNSGTVSADSAVAQGGKIVFKAGSRVDAGGTISARGAGGGTINLLADMQAGTVNVTGRLDASAPNSGNGGFIDTSAAHVQVANTASVSTLATNGASGTWLIDPVAFTIAASGGDITGATVSASLNSGNVVISNAGLASLDILVDDGISWNSAFSLTLNAVRNLSINQAISNAGSGSVNLRADANAACVAGAFNCGTVSFSGLGHVNAATNIYYNPFGSNLAADANGVGPTYATPTDYTANVTGTLNAYMLVNDANQLQAMNTNLAGKYALGSNIDATATSGWNVGAGFVPVGGTTTQFTGVFDGLNHTILNLTINRPAAADAGLFGYNAGNVSNVTFVSPTVTGGVNTGALAGESSGRTYNVGLSGGAVTSVGVGGSASTAGALIGTQWYNTIDSSFVNGLVTVASNRMAGGLAGYCFYCTISNSSASSDVFGVDYAGGLAGSLYAGSILGSYASGNVVSTGTTASTGGLTGQSWGSTISSSFTFGNVTQSGSGGYIGGLVGNNYSSITASYSTGTVTALTGPTDVGGLVGRNSGSISSSHALGDVNGAAYTGGLVGMNAGGSVSNVYASGAVSGGDYTGGLIGYNQNAGVTVNIAYATGSVNGNNYVGGLIGFNSGIVRNTYATGSVTGVSYVGGLAGDNDMYGGAISNSYATGLITRTGNFGGGLVGLGWGTVSNSYFDTTTTGQADRGMPAQYGTGISTEQMKTLSTFTGWSIANTGGAEMIWRIYEGQTYPLLTSFLTPLTVTASNFVKTYDGNAYTGGNGVTLSHSIGEMGLNGTLVYGGSAQGVVNAGSYAITPTGWYSDQQGYDITTVSGTLTVNPAALTASADFLSKRQGGIDPLLSYQLVGLQGADNAANTLHGSLVRVAGEAVGAYSVDQGSLALLTSNYTLNYVSGTFSILPSVGGTIAVPGSFFNTILIPGNDTAGVNGTRRQPPVVLSGLNGELQLAGADAQPMPVCR